VEQLVQIVGALCVLAAFTLAQIGRIDHQSRSYLIFNLVGSVILAVDAVTGRQFGFLLLEGVWALVSAASLIRRRGKRRTRLVDALARDPRDSRGREITDQH
jgi:hypothetical protein